MNARYTRDAMGNEVRAYGLERAADTLQWAESELETSVSAATNRAAVYLERGYPRVAISRTGNDPWPYTVAAYAEAPVAPVAPVKGNKR